MGLKLRRARLDAEDPLAEMYTPQAWDGFSRVDLMSFVERTFAEVDRAHPFSPNWHLELICSRLQAMAEGKNRRQIINVPPRSLKSICASVALVAWILGHDPTKRVMVVSYGQDLADKLARDTRQVMQSAWYRRMFPQAALSPVRSAVSDFDTVAGGGRMATSFGGAITGRGCDYIFIDDPIKPDEVLSARARQAVNEYVASTLRSRFNNQMLGSILVVMQRLHEEDLSGHLLATGGWEHLNLPAIAEVDESWSFQTPFGVRRASRSAGEALHPEHMDLQVLGELKADMGAYLFAAQYQQRPAPAGGGLVRLEQFGRYALAELPSKFDQVIQSWDTANKAGELNDYSVCTTWGRKDRFIYLMAVHRRKMEYPQLKTLIMTLRAQEQPNHVLIEDGSSGQQLLQELRHAGVPGVHDCKAQKDKAMRLMEVSAIIEAGQVLLPKEAPWLDAFESEFAYFPNGRHDDQVDSTSQALKWFMEQGRVAPILQFLRSEGLAARAAAEDEVVRVRPSIGYNTFIGRSGQTYMIDAEGVFALPRRELPLQLPFGWTMDSA